MALRLEINNLWHTYSHDENRQWTIKEVDLNVEPGELIGLLGPSGCGKTTLLRLIAGFEKPFRGSIALNGIQISSPNNCLAPERRGVGMVFQDYALFPHLTVWQNVCFGLKDGQDTDRPKWILDLLDIYEFNDRYPHELSGGQRQRVALARALAPGNSLVVLDEPFCSLDVEVRNKLRNQLPKVLSSCSATGILVTHDPQEALAICDRVAVMRHGSIQQFDAPAAIAHKPSTPFVGKFVLQKNLLPISNDNLSLLTPFGKIGDIEGINLEAYSSCMFGFDSIQLTLDSQGPATIESKEFYLDYWVLVVSLSNYQIRVKYDLEKYIEVGDKCKVAFKERNTFLLFPGCKEYISTDY